MNLTVLILWLAVLLNPETKTTERPAWFVKEAEMLTSKTGIWLTDNSAYQSEEEVFDHYEMHWMKSPDEYTLRAELYGVKNKQRVQKFWDFNFYWQAETKSVVLSQFGRMGMYGSGKMENQKDDMKICIQEMFLADGRSWKTKHESYFKDGKHVTTSFEQNKTGEWTKNRTYTWIQH